MACSSPVYDNGCVQHVYYEDDGCYPSSTLDFSSASGVSKKGSDGLRVFLYFFPIAHPHFPPFRSFSKRTRACAFLSSSNSSLSAVRMPAHRAICARHRMAMLFSSAPFLNPNTSASTVRLRQPRNRPLSIKYLTTLPHRDTHPPSSSCAWHRHQHRTQQALLSNSNLRYTHNRFNSFRVHKNRPDNTFKSPQPRHSSSKVRTHNLMQLHIITLVPFCSSDESKSVQ